MNGPLQAPLCKHCKWFKKPLLLKIEYGNCNHPSNFVISVVGGERLRDLHLASSMREAKCGLAGKLWEPRW